MRERSDRRRGRVGAAGPERRRLERYAGGVTVQRPPVRLGAVGFNPYRQQQRRTSDYVMVAAAVLVVAALLAWALFA